MVVLRAAKLLALWGTVVVVGAHGVARSLAAITSDARASWSLPPILLALVAGHALGRALTAPAERRRFGGDRHALALIVAALALLALSATEPHVSVKVLRERVPPFLAVAYPALAFVAPLLLRLTAARADAATQALLGAVFLTSLSGGLVLMDGPVALCLGVVVLLLHLAAADRRLPDGVLLRLGGALVVLLLVAGLSGVNPLQATPALGWIGALAALAVALASRPRPASDWRAVVVASVLAACAVALADVAVAGYLGRHVGWKPALRTSLTLFRQHPNFLAPYWAFHATLAAGLVLSWRRGRLVGVAAVILLSAATLHTASRAGTACLLAGLAGVPAVLLLLRLRARSRAVLLLAALVLPVAGVGFLLSPLAPAALRDKAAGWIESSVEYRLDAWRNAAAVVRQDPWLGIGPRTFLAVERFKPGSRFFNEPSPPHPHNVLLYVAQAAGVPALLLFLLLVLALAAALWRRIAAPDDSPERPALPRPFVAALLAACGALLLSDQLDLGLALDSVVPAPFFLLVGLAAAGASAVPGPRRTLAGVAWAALLLLLLVPLGLAKVAAATVFDQGLMLAALADHRNGDETLHARARAAMRRAIRLDPNHFDAYKMLATWIEHEDAREAERLLSALVERAPHYAPGQSLLAHLYLRIGRFEQAAVALMATFENAQGGVMRTRDRADAIVCLARLGRREEALELLVDSLRVDVGVLDAVPWKVDRASGIRSLAVAGTPQQPDLLVEEACERLFARHVAEEAAGQPVGRRFWLDTYNAFRRADLPTRALDVLDHLEAHVPEAEPHVLALERGNTLRELGDLAGARSWYERAYEHKPLDHFLTLAAEVQSEAARATHPAAGAGERDRPAAPPTAEAAEAHAAPSRPEPPVTNGAPAEAAGVGETPDGPSASAAAAVENLLALFESAGEILDAPTMWRDNLEAQSSYALAAGDPARAAVLLERTLLFEDDLLARSQRWRRVGELALAGGDLPRASSAFLAARAEASARPAGLPQLRDGYLDSLPGRLALALEQAWTAEGLDRDARLQRAWRLPDFFSPRLGPGLFRLSFLAENGRPDALLREADLLLRIDPGNVLATWAQLDAVEALGRHGELHAIVRDVVDRLGRAALVDRLLADLEATKESRLDDPRTWTDGAVLTMLKGRFDISADLFGEAASRAALPHERSHLLGWQARLLLLSDRAGNVAAAKERLVEAVRLAPGCGITRQRLETMP